VREADPRLLLRPLPAVRVPERAEEPVLVR
jgi:hypothetical protein